jgi:hypothetical protein
VAERGRVKQLGRKVKDAPVDTPESTFEVKPRRITTLFVGGITACNAAMLARGANPAELGRSWAIAYNGPQHFDHAVVDALVEVIREPGHEPTEWEQRTLDRVVELNLALAPEVPF